MLGWFQKKHWTEDFLGDNPRTVNASPEFVKMNDRDRLNYLASKGYVGNTIAEDGSGKFMQLSKMESSPKKSPKVSSPISGSSMQDRTRRSNVTPTGDNVVIVEPDRVVAAAPTPSASSESAYVPTGEAFYKINKGDNLWNLTGGDTELINKIAAYNNLDPNKIYADANLRLKNEWLTPSSRLLNNTLAGIRYPG